jgi:hypothetical protein
MLDMRIKTLRHALCGPQIHDPPLETNRESTAYHSSQSYDTVRLEASDFRNSCIPGELMGSPMKMMPAASSVCLMR